MLVRGLNQGGRKARSEHSRERRRGRDARRERGTDGGMDAKVRRGGRQELAIHDEMHHCHM